jgi:Phage integrase family.
LIESCPESQKVRSTRLIVTEDGTPMTVAMLRRRFDLTREAAGVQKSEFQMRDLRAKAGTDKAESSGDILQARDQLGHTTVVMMEQYIRNRLGKKVTPTK